MTVSLPRFQSPLLVRGGRPVQGRQLPVLHQGIGYLQWSTVFSDTSLS